MNIIKIFTHKMMNNIIITKLNVLKMVTHISPVKVTETIHLFFSPIYALKSSWEVLAEWLCSLEFFRPMIYFYPFESGILADYIFICFSIWTMRDPVSLFMTDVTLGFDC